MWPPMWEYSRPRVTLTGYNETLAGPGARRQVGRNGATLTGLDVLAAVKFAPFAGKRIGLITNLSGLNRNGRSNIDLMREAGVNIAAIFSPEHGFLGKEDRPNIEDSVHPGTGIKVFSLYGATDRPTPEMLKGIDALVFDIQDVGVHFYTYESTMAYALEAAAKAGIPYYVLDRPNPITGTRVEGPMLDATNRSYVGYMAGEPVRHGMTMGELAKMFNAENKIGANLTVVPMQGLAARRLVRFHQPYLDQPLAEHAQPERRDALSGHRHAGVRQDLGGPRHRHPVRACRRRFHRRARTGRVSQSAADSGNPRLRHEFYAHPTRSSRASKWKAFAS